MSSHHNVGGHFDEHRPTSGAGAGASGSPEPPTQGGTPGYHAGPYVVTNVPVQEMHAVQVYFYGIRDPKILHSLASALLLSEGSPADRIEYVEYHGYASAQARPRGGLHRYDDGTSVENDGITVVITAPTVDKLIERYNAVFNGGEHRSDDS